jgi:hypothetical protein
MKNSSFIQDVMYVLVASFGDVTTLFIFNESILLDIPFACDVLDNV